MSRNGPVIAEVVLVDTDILIDVGLGVEEAVKHLQELEQRAKVAVGTITQMELIVSCRNKRELSALNAFLSRFQVIGLSGAASDMATGLL